MRQDTPPSPTALPEGVFALSPMRKLVPLPQVPTPVALGRSKSIAPRRHAVSRRLPIGLGSQTGAQDGERLDGPCSVGTLAAGVQHQRTSEGLAPQRCERGFEILSPMPGVPAGMAGLGNAISAPRMLPGVDAHVRQERRPDAAGEASPLRTWSDVRESTRTALPFTRLETVDEALAAALAEPGRLAAGQAMKRTPLPPPAPKRPPTAQRVKRLHGRGAARCIPEHAPHTQEDAGLLDRLDGWYWVAPDGRQEFGPFDSAGGARADRDGFGDEPLPTPP